MADNAEKYVEGVTSEVAALAHALTSLTGPPSRAAAQLLASDWFAHVIAEARADALREAADDLGDTMIDTFWDAVAWLSARAASAESEAAR